MTETMQFHPAAVGATIAERYALRRLLGEGGMGQVFEAEHLALGRRFALKVLRLEKWSDELVQRFQREARALARISSARVAQVTDFGVEPQLGPYYVMELVEGETLERRIERSGHLRVDEALHIAAETCEALAEVHATGIVHRDLKPSNIGLPPTGPVAVKLLDFGLAASVDDSFMQRITRSQQVLGSLPYMAPEQFHGARPSPSMDIYAMGVVLFEMLVGRLPFKAPSSAALIHQILAAPVPSLAQVAPDFGIPARVEAVVKRLLAKDPADRYEGAHAAAQAIRETAEHSLASTLPGKRPLPPAELRPLHPENDPPDEVFAATVDVSSDEVRASGASSGGVPTVDSDRVPAASEGPGTAETAPKEWSSGQVVPPTSYPTPVPPAPASKRGPLVALLLGGGAVLGATVAVAVVVTLQEADDAASERQPSASSPVVEVSDPQNAVPAVDDGPSAPIASAEAEADPDAGHPEAGLPPEGEGAEQERRATRGGAERTRPGARVRRPRTDGARGGSQRSTRNGSGSATVRREAEDEDEGAAPSEERAPSPPDTRPGGGSWSGEIIEEPEF